MPTNDNNPNDRFAFYTDARGHYRWRRIAPNSRIVGASTEGYTNRKDAIANAIRNGYKPNKSTPMSTIRSQYIATVAPLAVQARAEYPALFPSLAIAQAVLESGNGRSELAAKYNNHFGIKSNSAWKGKVVSLRTKEVYDGREVVINDGFRVYDSIVESFRDRNRFLARNRRYTTNGVFSATTPQEQAKALQKAGYATDPKYAQKLIDLIAGQGLERFDVVDPESQSPESPNDAVTNVVANAPSVPAKPLQPSQPVQPIHAIHPIQALTPTLTPTPPRPTIPSIPIPTPPASKHSLAMRIFTLLRNLLRK
jgi:mannosyl-glycoprotein endo-beta-N-acetylglucosaminidase/stage II sporulation protein P